MKWFKHDANAAIDAKIEKLMAKYGLEGYGLYFYCLEMIARNVEKHNLTFELEHDAQVISRRLYMSEELVQEMMSFMVNLGLFENDRGVITCLKMASRTDEYTQKLIKDSNILTTISRQTPDSVGRKSELIEENRREEKRIYRGFTPPSPQEVQNYLNEKGITEFTGQQFVDHYASTGWYRGKTKIKSWQHCVGTWRKNNNTQKTYSKEDDWI